MVIRDSGHRCGIPNESRLRYILQGGVHFRRRRIDPYPQKKRIFILVLINLVSDKFDTT